MFGALGPETYRLTEFDIDAARPETKTKTAPAKEPPPQQIAKAEEPPRTPEARPSTREEFPERAIVTERELPTLKQLLPPLSLLFRCFQRESFRFPRECRSTRR